MVEAVIFDMDGLMIDTESLHHQSFKAVLEQYGVTPTPNEQGVIHVSGISSADNWRRFKQQYGFAAEDTELSRKKDEVHLELLRNNVVAMPGLFELLAELENNAIKLSIASSSIREHIDLVTERLQIRDFFTVIVSGEEVEKGKPAPDIFLKAAQALHTDPKDCVVLEDATNGIKAAKAAGMKAIAVPNRFNSHEDFSEADIVVASLEKIDMRLLNSITSTNS